MGAEKEKRVSRACLVRLELYLEVLEQFQRDGRESVTSAEIGEAVGLAPVKVRQDLFGLGSAGRPKVGYAVAHLIRLLCDVFDIGRIKPACIVGVGNLGRALAGSNIWDRAGYNLVSIFDNDPSVIGSTIGGIRVRSITELFGVTKTEKVEMAVITVPVSVAQSTADLLVSAGIKAIWNFAPVKLHTPQGVVVENQSLAWGLITLSQLSKGL